MAELRVFLFGNQALVTRAQIQQQLVDARGNPFLSLFLQRCSDALRHEVSQLSPLERKSVPAFNTVDELNDRAGSSDAHEGVQNALLCISQLAHYIQYVGGFRGRDNEGSQTCVVGLSTGLLAAAVVALSPTIPALMPLAVEAVLIAFRLGLHVKSTASNIETSSAHDDGSSWSYVITGTTQPEAQKALDDFHHEKTFPHSNQAYIAAYGADSVTISGPPTSLKQLFQKSSILASNHAAIPVYGPYHAPHLHKGIDIGQIVRSQDSKTSDLFSAYSLDLPLMSTSSGACFDKNLDAPTLFTAVIRDILTETLGIRKMVDGCTKLITEEQFEECRITSFGPCASKSMFAKAMQAEAGFRVTLHEDLAMKLSEAPSAFGDAPRTSKKPKLAIVGMAGRFPNAADHEKFWDLLEAGLDVHKKVPKDRFNVDTHYDPSGKVRNTSHTPFGCFIDEPGLFDPRFFNMSPREATQTDPMHRLGLASAYEALEMAGYVPNRTPSTRLERIGTFYGQTSDDWREINEAQDIDTYFITAGVRAFAPVSPNPNFLSDSVADQILML